MAGLTVEFPASIDPVALDEAKNFLRVDDIDQDDDLITTLISAATVACENFTRRSFINKGFLQTLDSFPYFTDTMLSQSAYPPSYYALPRYSTTLWNYSQMIKLFRPPCVSVDRITYCDSQSLSFQDLVPNPMPWYPQTLYAFNAQVTDNNGNVQVCQSNQNPSTQVKSGTKPPIPWNKNVGQQTVETTGVVWVNAGPAPTGEFGAYVLDSTTEPARIFPGIFNTNTNNGFWPSVLYVPEAVQIHFTAGYGTLASQVPNAIRVAIMQTVADLYENREPQKDDQIQLPKHVQQMLYPYRVIDFAPTRG